MGQQRSECRGVTYFRSEVMVQAQLGKCINPGLWPVGRRAGAAWELDVGSMSTPAHLLNSTVRLTYDIGMSLK